MRLIARRTRSFLQEKATLLPDETCHGSQMGLEDVQKRNVLQINREEKENCRE